MIINNIKSKLQKKEKSTLKMFENCLERKKLIADTKDHYKERLEKSKHDLSRAIAEFEDKCYDWTVIKAYYAIHHAGNALLSKKTGGFSKDHQCLIITLYGLEVIPKKLFEELMGINEKFSDTLSLDISFELRKISQYSVDEWKNITESDARTILELAKRFVRFAEGELI